MTRLYATAAALAAAAFLAGCGGGWWPFQKSQRAPAERIPAGATQYLCEGNKRLLVRHASDGKSAWVIFPDREFRLDRVAAASGERYTNGITTLSTSGDETMLEEGGARLFGGCKRAQGS